MGTAIRFSRSIFILETKHFDERKIGGCPRFLCPLRTRFLCPLRTRFLCPLRTEDVEFYVQKGSYSIVWSLENKT